MGRTFVCSSLALLLCVGIGLGADKGKGKARGKKGTQVHGKVVKVDTARNTLTLTVKIKQETSEKEIAVTDTTKFVTFNGEEKKGEVVGKNGLKEVNAGDRLRIRLDQSGAAQEISVNPPRKKKPAK